MDAEGNPYGAGEEVRGSYGHIYSGGGTYGSFGTDGR